MRLRRDWVFRAHTFGVVFVAVLAVLLHRSADRLQIESARRDVDALRSRVDELEKRPASVSTSEAVETLASVYEAPVDPPRIVVVGSGLLGSRRFYFDARLCDGVIRRCYIRSDSRFKKRDIDFCIQYLKDMQDYLWTGGYDLSLASSSGSSSIDEEVSSSSSSSDLP